MTAVLRLVPQPEPGDDLDRWLGQYATNTQDAYRGDLKQWRAWLGDTSLFDARPGDVNAWIGHMRGRGWAPATVARKVVAVASYYEWAREEGLTDCRPIPRRRPKVHGGAIQLGIDRAAAQRVLAEARRDSPRTYALVAVLVFCGLRVSEAVGLDLDRFGWQRGHRVVEVAGKGGKVRTVPIPAPAQAAVDAYLAGRAEGPVFITSTGRRWERRSAHRTVRRIGAKAGVDLYPHLLRHTAVTLALDAGAAVDRVQGWAGHASLDTTMRYARGRQQLDASPGYDVARWLAGNDEEAPAGAARTGPGPDPTEPDSSRRQDMDERNHPAGGTP